MNVHAHAQNLMRAFMKHINTGHHAAAILGPFDRHLAGLPFAYHGVSECFALGTSLLGYGGECKVG